MGEIARQDSWLGVAMRPDILKRGIKVGLVVGTILALINHGEKIFALDLDLAAALKIGLTYLVPYAVSTWASVQTARRADQAVMRDR